MNTIMAALVCLLVVAIGSVVYVALRNRIFFMMGLRNIPRRTAQTVLIVLGLMLSTLIISAAFGTGDTVDYSISNQAFTLLGHVDENVEAKGGGSDIPDDQYEKFQAALREENNPNIDGSLGVLLERVPAVNPASGLSEPLVTFAGLDEAALEGFPDVISVGTGKTLDVASLASDEAYMNESGADQLSVRPGDHVQIFVQSTPHDFTIVDIVEDRVLTGAANEENLEGMVTRLATLQDIFQHDQVSLIAVSANGGVRDTLDLTDTVEADLESVIRADEQKLDLGDSKQDAVEFAETFGNFMTTFFLLMGLFSIGAGILLIVMIFVMLAAERKPEMGMARAVGTKRWHLVETFLAEGMGYNILAAVVGSGLGILVAIGMARALATIFATSDFNLSIRPHFTVRTLIVSYSLGVVLTFATVTFSSWRVSNLNIVSAIRGTAEDRRPIKQRVTDWWWVLGGAGVCMSAITVAVLVFAPMGLVVPVGLWLLLRKGFNLAWAWILSAGGLLLGLVLLIAGMSSDLAFPFALGFSLMAAGAARALTLFKQPERPVYTTAGLLLLLMWGLTAGGRLESVFGPLNGDFEMFFLSGVAMVTASTYVLIYNSDIFLTALSRFSGVMGSMLPAMRTAIAYPLANRFRTGMTVAMISLVVFALTMMSTMNLNFNKLFLSDESRGGWDVIVEENPNNPIPDLATRLGEGGSNVADGFRSEGALSRTDEVSATEARQLPESNFEEYPILGMNEGFVKNSRIAFDHRAVGFESDQAVWDALATRDDVAVIDAFAASSGGFGDQEFDFSISGISERVETFDPIALELRDPASGEIKEVQLIGVISLGPSNTFTGLFIPDRTFREVFGEPDLSTHFVSLENPSESKDVAKEIESTLFTAGVQAESLKARAEEESALFRNFFYLMQAFMGLGLFVGIAAVGVIAFRTVVERRQQIGMLRAIGYKRSTVALSFLLESSFVTLLAIFSGIALAIWLSYFLITSDEFPEGAGYHVPWLQIIIFATFTYLASLLMTWIPARQAASIPTAEALRYE